MSTSDVPSDEYAPNHPQDTEEPWVAQFDDPREQNEVTFRPRNVTKENLRTEWITVELGHGTLIDVRDYQ